MSLFNLNFRLKPARFALAGAAFVLLAGVVLAFVGMRPPPPRTFQGSVKDLLPPAEIVARDGWKVEYLPIADTPEAKAKVDELLNYDDAVFAVYTRGTERVSIYLAYWTPGKMSHRLVAGHTPDVCWVGAGWRIVEAKSVKLKAESDGSAAPSPRSQRSAVSTQGILDNGGRQPVDGKRVAEAGGREARSSQVSALSTQPSVSGPQVSGFSFQPSPMSPQGILDNGGRQPVDGKPVGAVALNGPSADAARFEQEDAESAERGALSPQPSPTSPQLSGFKSQVSALSPQVSGFSFQPSPMSPQVSGFSHQVSAAPSNQQLATSSQPLASSLPLLAHSPQLLALAAQPGEYREMSLNGRTEHVVFWHLLDGVARSYGTQGLPPWHATFTDLFTQAFNQRPEQLFVRISDAVR